MTKRMTMHFAVHDDRITEQHLQELITNAIDSSARSSVEVLGYTKQNERVAKEERVCHSCGSPYFYHTRKIKQKYSCNSAGDPIQPEEETTIPDHEVYDYTPLMECRTCSYKMPLGSAVPEWFFHEIICDPEYDSTQLHVIENWQAVSYQDILDLPNDHEDLTGEGVIQTFSVPFLDGEYMADIKVVDEGGSSYIDAVIFRRLENGCYGEIYALEPSEELCGEYIFEVDDKKLRILLATHYRIAELPMYNPITDGNTNSNEEN